MKTEDKVKPLEHLSALRVEPGDVVVLQLSGRVSMDKWDRVNKAMREAFPCNRCIVLQDGATLGVVRGAMAKPERAVEATA